MPKASYKPKPTTVQVGSPQLTLSHGNWCYDEGNIANAFRNGSLVAESEYSGKRIIQTRSRSETIGIGRGSNPQRGYN
jgi:hypothetical protein